MTRPLVSVVIPAYNASATLGRAIESVLAQTFDDCELIVVDDGSTDDTRDVASSHGKAVRLIRADHSGPGAARNGGARIARGRFLAWLDADDEWYPRKLELQVGLAQSNDRMDFISGNYHYIDAEGHVLGTGFERNPWLMGWISRMGARGTVSFLPEDFPTFVRHRFGATITMLVDRDLFMRVGGFPEQFQVAEDIHLLMRIVSESREFGAVLDPVAAYHVHQASTVRRDPLFSQRETIRAYQDLRHVLAHRGAQVRQAISEPLSMAYLDYAVILARLGNRWEGVKSAFRSWRLRPNRDTLSTMLSMAVGG